MVLATYSRGSLTRVVSRSLRKVIFPNQCVLRITSVRFHGPGPKPIESAPINGAQSLNAKREAKRVVVLRRITRIGVIVNLILAPVKAAVGHFDHSEAMLADAMHCFGDMISDFICLIVLRYALRPPSEVFPYGRNKFEPLGTVSIALILMGSGFGMMAHAMVALRACIAAGGEAPASGMTSFIVAAMALVVKEVLFRVTYDLGIKYSSPVVVANAWHHRSDAVAALVAMVGIVGSLIGVPALDPVAGVAVAGMIVMAGLHVLRTAIFDLMDTAPSPAHVADLIQRAESADPVRIISARVLRARVNGGKAEVEICVRVPPTLPTRDLIDLTHHVRAAIEEPPPIVESETVSLGEKMMGKVDKMAADESHGHSHSAPAGGHGHSHGGGGGHGHGDEMPLRYGPVFVTFEVSDEPVQVDRPAVKASAPKCSGDTAAAV